MNLPNTLTTIRMILIVPFVMIMQITPDGNGRFAALAIFIIASMTDFLDGYIARKNHLVTNFGKFMDPLADKLLVSAGNDLSGFHGSTAGMDGYYHHQP